jgi:hypothetical protein
MTKGKLIFGLSKQNKLLKKRNVEGKKDTAGYIGE